MSRFFAWIFLFAGLFFWPLWLLSVALFILAHISKRPIDAPSRSTHVRCPDCQELVLKQAKVCKHCGCKLIPQP